MPVAQGSVLLFYSNSCLTTAKLPPKWVGWMEMPHAEQRHPLTAGRERWWSHLRQASAQSTGALEETPKPQCVQQENGYNPIYLPPLELAVVFDSCQELGW